jgi:hypothetical protein
MSTGRFLVCLVTVLVTSVPACGDGGGDELFESNGTAGRAAAATNAGADGSAGSMTTFGGGGLTSFPQGGAATGGTAGSGSDGGAGPEGRGGTAAASPDGGACPTGTKECSGLCVSFDPFVGCGAPGCDPCTVPPGAVGTCSGSACSYECTSGYVREGDGCVPGDGGIVSDGGPSGAGGSSGLASCPSTQPATGGICIALPFPCTYGTVSCMCLLAASLPVWLCQ